MSKRYDTVSFLSDYGTKDEFVGVAKSVVRSIAPHVTVVDITHEVAPYDVRAASLALVRSAHYMCPGVVLAVVDPDVGTERRAIAVEVGNGESVLVGPDNGLLAPVVALVGGADRAVELSNLEYQLEGPSATFAGRDVFAPAAAHMCNGVDMAELGPAIDPGDLKPAMLPFSAEKEGVIEASVLWVDRYGNAQLNVTPEQLADYKRKIVIKTPKQEFTATRVQAFAELNAGEVGLMVDASGLMSLVLDRGAASERFSLEEEIDVTLRPAT